MARKMRIAVFGAAGFVASVCIRTLVERDVEIVAAFGNKNHLREDLGELLGLGRMGVILSPSPRRSTAPSPTSRWTARSTPYPASTTTSSSAWSAA